MKRSILALALTSQSPSDRGGERSPTTGPVVNNYYYRLNPLQIGEGSAPGTLGAGWVGSHSLNPLQIGEGSAPKKNSGCMFEFSKVSIPFRSGRGALQMLRSLIWMFFWQVSIPFRSGRGALR